MNKLTIFKKSESAAVLEMNQLLQSTLFEFCQVLLMDYCASFLQNVPCFVCIVQVDARAEVFSRKYSHVMKHFVDLQENQKGTLLHN